MARSTMANLISRFRLLRGDITSSVLTDGQVENLFDLTKSYADQIALAGDASDQVFQTPAYFNDFEIGYAIFDAGDVDIAANVNATNTDEIRGMFSFDSAQSPTLRIRGYYYNLNLTVALSYRQITSSDDLWIKHKRGEVELTKRDLIDLANQYESMGFRPALTITGRV